MIPIHWTTPTEIKNLPELLDSFHNYGGKLVEYQRVMSVLVYTQTTPKIEWVPPGTNRTIFGLKHTFFCLFLGWWSLAGVFWNIDALIKNLMGGIDVTGVFTQPPPLPGQPIDSTALREMERQKKMHGTIFAFALILIIIATICFFIVPQF